MEAREKGGFLGILKTQDGFLLEAPVANIAFLFLNEQGKYYFKTPKFDGRILAGTGIRRALQVAEGLKN